MKTILGFFLETGEIFTDVHDKDIVAVTTPTLFRKSLLFIISNSSNHFSFLFGL